MHKNVDGADLLECPPTSNSLTFGVERGSYPIHENLVWFETRLGAMSKAALYVCPRHLLSLRTLRREDIHELSDVPFGQSLLEVDQQKRQKALDFVPFQWSFQAARDSDECCLIRLYYFGVLEQPDDRTMSELQISRYGGKPTRLCMMIIVGL